MLKSKTFWAAVAGLLAAWAGFLAGTVSLEAAIGATLAAIAVIGQRQATERVLKASVLPLLLTALGIALTACATTQTPATVQPKGTLGQASTRATAAFLKSAATTDEAATVAPEAQAVGAEVTVPFALWNPTTNSWEVPLDKDGKPYMVRATAVRDFNYIVGTVTNTATVSGTAEGSQTQGGTAQPSGTATGPTISPPINITPGAGVTPK